MAASLRAERARLWFRIVNMTQVPPQHPDQPHAVAATAPTNGLGIAGLVTSIVGWFTCGLICPIGLLISLIALLKKPRGFAVAGAIVGALGTLFLVLVGFTAVAGFFGMKKGFESIGRNAVIMTAQFAIDEAYVTNNNSLPTDAEGNALIASKNIHLNGEAPVYAMTSPTTYTLTMPGPDKVLGTADDESRTCQAGSMHPQTQPTWQPPGQPTEPGQDVESTDDF